MALKDLKFKIMAKDLTQGVFKALKRGMGGILKTVFSLKSAFVGLAGVGGIGLLAKSSLDSIDKIGKLSTRLGIATETLGRFGHIAKLSGIEFNAFVIGIQRSQRRIAEAAKGNKGLSDALHQLGLDANELLKLNAEDRFFAMAEALDGVADKSERLRLAFKFFDSEGVAMLQTLSGGIEGLRGMADEADKLGLVMSSKAVRGVESANDSITKLGGLFKGVTDNLTASFAPVLEKIVDIFTNDLLKSIQDNGGTVSAWSNSVALDILQLFKRITLAMSSFSLSAIQAFDALYSFIGRDTSPLEVFVKNIEENTLQAFGFIDRMKVLIGNSLDEIAEKNAKRNLLGDPKKLMDWENGVNRALDKFKTKSDNTANQFEEGFGRALSSLSGAFENFFMTGKLSFKSFISSMRAELSKLLANKLMMSLLGSAFGGPGGGLSFGNLAGARAAGGPVSAGKSFMVGENGPEIFNPSSNGTITKNGDIGGGGATVIQNNNFAVDVAKTVRAEIANMAPLLVQATALAVNAGQGGVRGG